MANIEQDIAISASPSVIKEKSRLINQLFQCPQGFFEGAVLPAAFPKKPAGLSMVQLSAKDHRGGFFLTFV
jgi:hypothetical protein